MNGASGAGWITDIITISMGNRLFIQCINYFCVCVLLCLWDCEVARDLERDSSPGEPQANSANLRKFPLLDKKLGGTLREGGRRLLMPSSSILGLLAVRALAIWHRI